MRDRAGALVSVRRRRLPAGLAASDVHVHEGTVRVVGVVGGEPSDEIGVTLLDPLRGREEHEGVIPRDPSVAIQVVGDHPSVPLDLVGYPAPGRSRQQFRVEAAGPKMVDWWFGVLWTARPGMTSTRPGTRIPDRTWQGA